MLIIVGFGFVDACMGKPKHHTASAFGKKKNPKSRAANFRVKKSVVRPVSLPIIATTTTNNNDDNNSSTAAATTATSTTFGSINNNNNTAAATTTTTTTTSINSGSCSSVVSSSSSSSRTSADAATTSTTTTTTSTITTTTSTIDEVPETNSSVVDNLSNANNNNNNVVQMPSANNTVVTTPTSNNKSASAKKLAYFKNVTPKNDDYLLTVSHHSLANVFQQFCCAECGSQNNQLKPQPDSKHGLYLTFSIVCQDCLHVVKFSNGDKPSKSDDSGKDNLNKLMTLACRESGVTFEQLARLFGILGVVEPMSRRTFTTLSNTLYDDCKNAMNAHFKDVTAIVRKAYGELRGVAVADDELLEIAVTYDGTWHKRGRTSHHGVGVAIEILTGLVIDFEVLTNTCTECTKNVDGSLEWKRKHEASGRCERNYDGYSGGMEVIGAVRIWKRSIDLHGMIYKYMLSDGDSKAYNAVSSEMVKLNPDYVVEKEDCINHVSKRLYTGLVDLKNAHKGKDKIHGKGRLTDDMMRKLQSYYGNALHKHAKTGGSLENLQKTILATLYHYMSDNSNPLHDFCPTDPETTYCDYNRLCALDRLDELPSQPNPKLPRRIGELMKPVYMRLTNPDLLGRCHRALTQNANESFNQMIWQRCPKIYWSGHKSIFIGTVLASLKFNKGAAAVFDVLQGPVGVKQCESAKKTDRVRVQRVSKERLAQKMKRRYTVRVKRAKDKDEKADVSYRPGGYNDMW